MRPHLPGCPAQALNRKERKQDLGRAAVLARVPRHEPVKTSACSVPAHHASPPQPCPQDAVGTRTAGQQVAACAVNFRGASEGSLQPFPYPSRCSQAAHLPSPWVRAPDVTWTDEQATGRLPARAGQDRLDAPWQPTGKLSAAPHLQLGDGLEPEEVDTLGAGAPCRSSGSCLDKQMHKERNLGEREREGASLMRNSLP